MGRKKTHYRRLVYVADAGIDDCILPIYFMLHKKHSMFFVSSLFLYKTVELFSSTLYHHYYTITRVVLKYWKQQIPEMVGEERQRVIPENSIGLFLMSSLCCSINFELNKIFPFSSWNLSWLDAIQIEEGFQVAFGVIEGVVKTVYHCKNKTWISSVRLSVKSLQWLVFQNATLSQGLHCCYTILCKKKKFLFLLLLGSRGNRKVFFKGCFMATCCRRSKSGIQVVGLVECL